VLKNKIHNILNAHGIVSHREDFSSDKGLAHVLSYAVNEAAKIELGVIVEQIRYLNEGIKKLDEEIKQRGSQLKGYENITSIKGIGGKSGSILLSIIGDIDDNYESEKKFPDSVLTESKNIQSLILNAVAKRALFTQLALPPD